MRNPSTVGPPRAAVRQPRRGSTLPTVFTALAFACWGASVTLAQTSNLPERGGVYSPVPGGATLTPSPGPAPTPLAPPTPEAAPSRDGSAEAELTLWARLKDTREPAELEAFLAAFPNGRLAPLARERLAALRQPAFPPIPRPGPDLASPRLGAPSGPALPPLPAPGPAPVKPQAPVAGADDKDDFAVTPALISEVQERLYNLNYDPGPRRGTLNPATRQAIREYQGRVGLIVNGLVDPGTVQRLRAAQAVEQWGGLAFAARGGYGAVWNRPNRRAAETDAIALCRKNTGSSCKVVTAAGSGCSALAVYSANGRQGAYAVTQSTIAEARSRALANCRSGPSPKACTLRYAFCADASHERGT